MAEPRHRGGTAAGGDGVNGVDPLLPARKVKHALFVARKRSQRVCRTTRFRVISALGPVKVRVAPYTFREERYHRQFVC